MSMHLLEQLEAKIDDVIETIEIMRLQIEELEAKNASLHTENTAFRNRQSLWEQGLTSLLGKLEDVSSDSGKALNHMEHYAPEEVEALA